MDGHQGPPPPPPPPPHGANPKTSAGGSGLPPGNYDIFIIPPHSAGSGFLYLPSLRPQLNSFLAGAASAFFACWLWAKISPMLKAFVSTVTQSGAGFGMVLMLGIVAVGAFFAGSAGQIPGVGPGGSGPPPGATGQAPPNGFPPGGAHAGPTPPPNGYTSSGPTPNGYPNGAPNGQPNGAGQQHWGHGAQGSYAQSHAPPPQPPPEPHQQAPPQPPPPPPPPPRTEPYGARSEADGSERAQPRPRAYSNASASWQKAKDEQRRREEERKKEQEAKRKEEEEAKAKADAERKARAAEEKLRWEKQRAREKEERERKERERVARERLEKAKAEVERARLEKEIKEKLEKEAAEAKEKAEREAREAAARERIAALKAKSEVGGGSKFGVGERTNPYSLDPNDRTPTPAATAAQAAAKKYERPSAQSYVGTSTAESYRPYDKHKHAGSGSSVYSESYAPSQSTAPSSAPPRQTGPYSTTDPDKVVLKAVYSFSDSFPKPQTSLVAGQDGVTDGLILKIGTEGMFVDDDVKGIGLREWDVKTWTMKSVESISIPKKALYILRATIKDAVKTNFVFIVGASEEWKAKKGVEVLKGGSLARTGLASAMSSGEAQRLMTLLGW